MSGAVHRIRSLYKLSRQKRTQHTVKQLEWNVLQKEKCLSAGTEPDIFQGRVVFVELEGTLINISSKTQEEKSHRETF